MPIRRIEPLGNAGVDVYTENVSIVGTTYAFTALSDETNTTRVLFPNVQGSRAYVATYLEDLALDPGERIVAARIAHISYCDPIADGTFYDCPCDLIFDFKRPHPQGGFVSSQLAHYEKLRTALTNYVGPWIDAVNDFDGTPTDWTEDIVNAANQLVVYESGTTQKGQTAVVKASIDFLTNYVPEVDNIGPSGISSSAIPLITWDYHDEDGDRQKKFRVLGFTPAQVAADGFDPNLTVPAVDSGEVSSAQRVWGTSTLDNGQTYDFYVTAFDGYFWSDLVAGENYTTLTIDVGTPAIPEITVNWNGSLPPNETVALISYDNLFDKSVSMEAQDMADLDDFIVTAGLTPSFTTTDPLQGSRALRVTNSSGAEIEGVISLGGVRVGATMRINALLSARANGSGVDLMQLSVRYLDEDDDLVDTAYGPAIQPFDAGGWAQPFVSNLEVPAGAVTAHFDLLAIINNTGSLDIDALIFSAQRLNLARNPLMDRDTNSDGLPDQYSSVNTGSGDDAPTYGYDADALLFGTHGTQKMTVTENTGTKGWSQDISLPSDFGEGGHKFSLAAWLKTDLPSGATITLDCSQVDTWDTTNEFVIDDSGFVCVEVRGTTEAQAGNGRATISITTDEADVVVWCGLVQPIFIVAEDTEPYEAQVNVLPNNWTRGGVAGRVTHEIQRSLDGLTDWEPMRLADQRSVFSQTGQLYQATDWDIPDTDGRPLHYRARSLYREKSTGVVVASPWTIVRTATPPVTLDGFYMVSLTDSRLSRRFDAEIPVPSTTTEDQGVFKPLGKKEAVVVHGDLGGEDGSFKIKFFTKQQFEDFEKLREAQKTHLCIDPFGERRYIDWGATRDQDRVFDQVRHYSFPYVETARPQFTETEIAVINQFDNTKVPPLPSIPSEPPGPDPDPEPEPEPETPPVTTTSAKIQFGDAATVPKAGYQLDFGGAYSVAKGYGWVDTSGNPLSLVGNGRDRGGAQLNELLDGFVHMQLPDSTQGVHAVGWWQMDIVNGTYYVKVGVGDPNFTNSVHKVVAESGTTIIEFTPTTTTKVAEMGVAVTVADGKLTLKPTGGTNTKLCYVEVTPGSGPPATPTEQIPPRGSGLWALDYEDLFPSINTSNWGIYQYGPGNENVGFRHPSMVKKGADGLEVWTQLQTNGQRWGGGLFLKGRNRVYARAELEVKVDLGPGSGPAIMMWMSSNDWPEDIEFDMLEIPRGARDRGNHTMHRGPLTKVSSNPDRYTHPQSGKAFTHNWLNWTWLTGEWTPSGWRVYVNGVKANEWTDAVWKTLVPHHLVIQNDIGGNGFIQAPNGTEPNPSKLYVRRVRWFRYTGPT